MALMAEFMSEESAERREMALNKPALRAAFDATEAWVTANQAAFNAALPQPARGALTARQKARLLCLVVRKRWEDTQ